MKIATLQFSPSLGAVQQNINLANALLQSTIPGSIDLLVLPELAFTGYNFPSLEAIAAFLEPTAAGPTAQWAISTAQRLGCHITVGYPEVSTSDNDVRRNYNSTVTVSPEGNVLANYRKSFLYYTDETWAFEGPDGSSPVRMINNTTTNGDAPSHRHPAGKSFFVGQMGDLRLVGHGICMDINPYQFTAPWDAYEFANRMLDSNVRLVVLSMAWLTRLLPSELEIQPDQPDMETVAYWLERFFPFIETAPREEVVVVFANRCGTEGNGCGSREIENGEEVEEGDRVCYAGSSCVMVFQGGRVRVFDRGEGVAVMGKGEEGVLVVDTSQTAKYSIGRKR